MCHPRASLLGLPTSALLVLLAGACQKEEDPGAFSGTPTTTTPSDDGSCALAANTTAGATSSSGCALLTRDTSSCKASREAAGLSGFWLNFSCRVSLSVSGDEVIAVSDGLPDYASNYFTDTDACHETYTGAIQNPNLISTQSYSVHFPRTPDTEETTMQRVTIVGMALNGVGIFGNFAAPGDDIFQEALTFDRCAGHPERTGVYHYHAEPLSITQDDDNFVGVMRDGNPIYGRRCVGGDSPTLDTYGGHTSATPDSTTPIYHYHVNEQTSTGTNTAGETQWFITKGYFRGSLSTCDGC